MSNTFVTCNKCTYLKTTMSDDYGVFVIQELVALSTRYRT